jgi:hypothetical protein
MSNSIVAERSRVEGARPAAVRSADLARPNFSSVEIRESKTLALGLRDRNQPGADLGMYETRPAKTTAGGDITIISYQTPVPVNTGPAEKTERPGTPGGCQLLTSNLRDTLYAIRLLTGNAPESRAAHQEQLAIA